jgi:hypothetical protein
LERKWSSLLIDILPINILRTGSDAEEVQKQRERNKQTHTQEFVDIYLQKMIKKGLK